MKNSINFYRSCVAFSVIFLSFFMMGMGERTPSDTQTSISEEVFAVGQSTLRLQVWTTNETGDVSTQFSPGESVMFHVKLSKVSGSDIDYWKADSGPAFILEAYKNGALIHRIFPDAMFLQTLESETIDTENSVTYTHNWTLPSSSNPSTSAKTDYTILVKSRIYFKDFSETTLPHLEHHIKSQ